MWWFEECGGRKGCLLLVSTGGGRVLVTGTGELSPAAWRSGRREAEWLGMMLWLPGGVPELPPFHLAQVQLSPPTTLSSTVDVQRESPLVTHQ